MMKFVILAAGEGRRLRPLTNDRPKAMVPIIGRPIIDYQLEALQKVGVDKSQIVIIGGYAVEVLKPHLEGYEIIYNPYWNCANNVISVKIALEEIDDDMMIINSDVIFDHRIIKLLLDGRFAAAAVVDRTVDLGIEEMKVVLGSNGYIKLFSKYISPSEGVGEYIGISYIPSYLRECLMEIIVNMERNNETNKWYEDAYNYLCQIHPMIPIFCDGYLWTEVDNLNDLKIAERIAKELENVK